VAVAGAAGTPIVVFDAGLTRAETLATAHAPVRALTFTGDGAGLVAATSAGRVGLLVGLRTADGARAFSLPLPAVPTAVASRRDGRSYVVTGTAARDTTGAAVVLSIVGDPQAALISACRGEPAGLVLGPDAERLYATCPEDTVVEIDLRLRRRVREVPLARGPSPAAACGAGPPAVGPGSTVLLIPCRRAGVILKVDRVTLRTVDVVEAGVVGIHEVAEEASGTIVALASGPPPVIVRLDRIGRPAGPPIELPAGASRLVATGHASTAYVSGEGPDGGWLARVDLAGGTIRVAPIPAGHTAIAVWPDRTPPVMWFAKSLTNNNNPGPKGPGLWAERRRRHAPRTAANARKLGWNETSRGASLRLTSRSAIRFPVTAIASNGPAETW
jgi:hypothetical protein